MTKKKKRKKKPKLVRVMSRFLKSDWGPAWIGLAVVMLVVLFFAVKVGEMFLFWAFAVAVLVMIGIAVLVEKVNNSRAHRGSHTDSDSDPTDRFERRWESRETDSHDDHVTPDPPTYGPTTNLPDHFN